MKMHPYRRSACRAFLQSNVEADGRMARRGRGEEDGEKDDGGMRRGRRRGGMRMARGDEDGKEDSEKDDGGMRRGRRRGG